MTAPSLPRTGPVPRRNVSRSLPLSSRARLPLERWRRDSPQKSVCDETTLIGLPASNQGVGSAIISLQSENAHQYRMELLRFPPRRHGPNLFNDPIANGEDGVMQIGR